MTKSLANTVASSADKASNQPVDRLIEDEMAAPERSATLLVFTLGASWETRRRKLLPAGWNQAERALHRACLDETLAAGRASGCRLVVSSPRALELPTDVERLPQTGKSFGVRLQHAFSAAQAMKAGPVVLVGSDVPGLTAAHLHRTFDLLARDPARVVIGPSPDGGIYLLAANRPIADSLPGVRWCCDSTLRSLKRVLRREGYRVCLLPPLRDLDRQADLEAWLAQGGAADLLAAASARWQGLLRWLIDALRERRRPLTPALAPVPRRGRRLMRLGRAPPSSTLAV